MNKVEAVITIFEPNHLLTLYLNYLVFIIIIFLIQFRINATSSFLKFLHVICLILEIFYKIYIVSQLFSFHNYNMFNTIQDRRNIFLSIVSPHLLDIILQNFFKFPQIFFKFSSFTNSSNFVKRVSFHREKMFPSVYYVAYSIVSYYNLNWSIERNFRTRRILSKITFQLNDKT